VSNVISMDIEHREATREACCCATAGIVFATRLPPTWSCWTGKRHEDGGVTSDISMGIVYLYEQPLPSKPRGWHYADTQGAEGGSAGRVRIVKPRIGMGIEFMTWKDAHEVLRRWVEQLSKSR